MSDTIVEGETIHPAGRVSATSAGGDEAAVVFVPDWEECWHSSVGNGDSEENFQQESDAL